MNAGSMEASVFLQFSVFALFYIQSAVICIFRARTGSKYLFQSSFPCTFCLVQPDHTVSIGEASIVCHLTDHSIGNLEISNFSGRYLCDQVSKARCEEVSRIQIVLDLYAAAVSKCHLADCRRNPVTVQGISRYDPAVSYIFMEF